VTATLSEASPGRHDYGRLRARRSVEATASLFLAWASVTLAGAAHAQPAGNPSTVAEGPAPKPNAASGGGAPDDDRGVVSREPTQPGRSHLIHGPRLELALGSLSPADPALDDVFSSALSVEAVGVGYEPIGIAVGYGLTFGLNGDANAYFDVRGALGPGLRIGPLMLAPMLGVGVNVLGGDDPGAYHFGTAAYWYAEGRLRLEGGFLGVEQSVSRAARGTFSKAAIDAPSEIRLVSRAFVLIESYYEISAGFAYTDYASAEAMSGLVGFGF
jgi:hypothetical protein